MLSPISQRFVKYYQSSQKMNSQDRQASRAEERQEYEPLIRFKLGKLVLYVSSENTGMIEEIKKAQEAYTQRKTSEPEAPEANTQQQETKSQPQVQQGGRIIGGSDVSQLEEAIRRKTGKEEYVPRFSPSDRCMFRTKKQNP